jgi:hypothetical protein
MINLSMTQVLELWDELRDCIEGYNRYGRDTAEIYAYRLTKQHKPGGTAGDGYGDEEECQLAASLTELVRLFCFMHNCTAEIACSGTAIPGTVRIFSDRSGGAVPPFSHRAHVKIISNEAK